MQPEIIQIHTTPAPASVTGPVWKVEVNSAGSFLSRPALRPELPFALSVGPASPHSPTGPSFLPRGEVRPPPHRHARTQIPAPQRIRGKHCGPMYRQRGFFDRREVRPMREAAWRRFRHSGGTVAMSTNLSPEVAVSGAVLEAAEIVGVC